MTGLTWTGLSKWPIEHLQLSLLDIRREMLAEDSSCLLIGGAHLGTIPVLRRFEHPLKCESADSLAWSNHEWDVMRTNLQHGLYAAKSAVFTEPEPRVEKACVVGAYLATRRFVCRHFGSVPRRDTHAFSGRQ